MHPKSGIDALSTAATLSSICTHEFLSVAYSHASPLLRFVFTVKTQDRKYEMMRQQVISKIRWGSRDQEVLDWLQDRHGIKEGEADTLLKEAHQAKRKAVRSKALLSVAFSSLGILLAAGFVALQVWEGLFVIGYGSILIIGIGFVSIGVFCRSLVSLLTGQTKGSVD